MQAFVDPIQAAVDDAFRSLGAVLARTPTLLVAMLVVALFILVARWVSRLTHDAVRLAHLDPSLRVLIDRLITAAIIVFGVTIGFGVLGLSLATIAATFGVAGLIVGFALKDILENFIAGVLILWRRPFRVTDQIRVAGNEGIVRDITFRTTTLETDDGIEVLIPNAQIINQAVYNLTSYGARRTTITLTVPRTTDLDRLRPELLQTVREVIGVQEDPAPEILLLGGTADNYELHLRYWTLPEVATSRLIESRVRRAIAPILTAASQQSETGPPAVTGRNPSAGQ